MNFFRTTDTTDTTIWKPGFRVMVIFSGPSLFEAALSLNRVKYHGNLQILIPLLIPRMRANAASKNSAQVTIRDYGFCLLAEQSY